MEKHTKMNHDEIIKTIDVEHKKKDDNMVKRRKRGYPGINATTNEKQESSEPERPKSDRDTTGSQIL